MRAAMRLLTHNMLVSNAKGVSEAEGYPLTLEVTEHRREETEFDAPATRKTMETVKYDALRGAARAVAIDLPEVYDGDDEDVLRKVHVALCDVHVIEGCLVCPKSGRRFPINNGMRTAGTHIKTRSPPSPRAGRRRLDQSRRTRSSAPRPP